MLSLLRLRQRVCMHPSMQAEPRAVTTEALLLTLFSGPDTGGSLRERKCGANKNNTKTNTKQKSSRLNVQRDALIPGGTDFAARDYVVSMWKPLHFIFLIEPPAAPTSRAGPKRPTAAVT